MDVQPEARLARVVAVPAYLLNDTPISYGNLRRGELFQEVENAIAGERVT